ncbi:MAG: hypothetical protein ACJAWS_002405 [Oleiphilaceae bacterium]|jgi:hypothetical protein
MIQKNTVAEGAALSILIYLFVIAEFYFKREEILNLAESKMAGFQN